MSPKAGTSTLAWTLRRIRRDAVKENVPGQARSWGEIYEKRGWEWKFIPEKGGTLVAMGWSNIISPRVFGSTKSILPL